MRKKPGASFRFYGSARKESLGLAGSASECRENLKEFFATHHPQSRCSGGKRCGAGEYPSDEGRCKGHLRRGAAERYERAVPKQRCKESRDDALTERPRETPSKTGRGAMQR